MSISVDELRKLKGTPLPGGDLVIEAYENAILEHAVRSPQADAAYAHPLWFVVISLRCLGISVDELCDMAGKTDNDTLLFGNCAITQRSPLAVGGRYHAKPVVSGVGSRTTRDNARLDHLDIRMDIVTDAGDVSGTVTSTYLFKRGGAA